MTDLNVINISDIDDYLKRFCGGDERLETFLISAMSSIIRKTPECMEVLETLPDDAPEWLVKKWDQNPVWHRFDYKKNIRLSGRVDSLVTQIEEAIEYDMPWTHNLDKWDRPYKLLRASSFEDLWNIFEKDQKHIKRIRREITSDRIRRGDFKKDFERVMTFSDGYYIVRLKTENALVWEGGYLDHCIGNDDYVHQLQDSVREFYSLRNCDDMPCVSMALEKDMGRLTEIRGKKNSYPKGDYIPYIATFCSQADLVMCEALSFHQGFEYLQSH